MSDEKVTVKVLHRYRPYRSRADFQPSDWFLRVLKFEWTFPGAVETLLKVVWEQLNVDEPVIEQTIPVLAEWAQEYRRQLHPSLKVGDVVVIGEQAFALDRRGWRPVTLTVDQVWCEHSVLATYVTEDREWVVPEGWE
jgi:hypothetical protein